MSAEHEKAPRFGGLSLTSLRDVAGNTTPSAEAGATPPETGGEMPALQSLDTNVYMLTYEQTAIKVKNRNDQMAERKRILLQTTIPFTEDDWHVERFSLLRDHLASLTDGDGNALYDVTARNRENDADGNDRVLPTIGDSEFDQLWLFAVDVGNGLSVKDCEGITKFRRRGGGIMATRDHQDLGSSLCSVGGIGAAHFFHTENQEPDESRRQRDDTDNQDIDFPNYHSGNNGDFQPIKPYGEVHDLLRRDSGELIQFFPAHPHEGSVGAPPDDHSARVIACGTSQSSGRDFNLIVAFEKGVDRSGNTVGRGVAESSFHHFVDYNWNPDMGCPTFLTEKPGNGYRETPERLNDVKQYVANLAKWLSS
jgi:hypothetical protein